MRYFFGICKQKRKILTFMCSLFHPFSPLKAVLARGGHMHHISYRRIKYFQPLLRRHIFSVFCRFDYRTDIFINGHYYSLQIPVRFYFESQKPTKKLPTHTFIFHLRFCGRLVFLSLFFSPGPENNLISCVL